jgi:lysophospholipase L1-like esterase
VAVWIAYAVDWERLSRRYPQTADEIDFGEHENRIETSEDVLARLAVELAAPTGDAERILLVGTSQTWGAGALRDDQTLARRLGQELSESYPAAVIAAAIPGSNAAELFAHYRDEWIEWGPDLVVINLSSNDRDNPDFGADIRAFIELNAERGIATLLIAEPNSLEAVHSLAHNHVVLRELAAATGVDVLDMHEYLADQLDRGWLWWDFVHLTSFGQDLFARRLAEAITGDS